MKKWLNTLFFGGCFIASLILLMYSILIFEGNPISAAALGIVVLITGYLFMDSIRSGFIKSTNDMKSYYDQIMKEEMERWNERYTEINNLQKATYTATKKTAAILADHMGEVLQRFDDLENHREQALQRIMGLQKKSLEGQKTALNLEINYNKENTERILEALRVDEIAGLKDQMNYIITLLESNAERPKEYAEQTVKEGSVIHQVINPTGGFVEDTSASVQSTPDTEAEGSVINGEEIIPNVVPIYDDPNKALSADEIAALFASFGQ